MANRLHTNIISKRSTGARRVSYSEHCVSAPFNILLLFYCSAQQYCMVFTSEVPCLAQKITYTRIILLCNQTVSAALKYSNVYKCIKYSDYKARTFA